MIQSQVVLLNQVTTKFSEGSFQLALALGEPNSNLPSQFAIIIIIIHLL